LNKKSNKTKKATKVAVSVFWQYLEERKVDEKELLTSNSKPAAVLRKFYTEARKKNCGMIKQLLNSISQNIMICQIKYLPLPLASAND